MRAEYRPSSQPMEFIRASHPHTNPRPIPLRSELAVQFSKPLAVPWRTLACRLHTGTVRFSTPLLNTTISHIRQTANHRFRTGIQPSPLHLTSSHFAWPAGCPFRRRRRKENLNHESDQRDNFLSSIPCMLPSSTQILTHAHNTDLPIFTPYTPTLTLRPPFDAHSNLYTMSGHHPRSRQPRLPHPKHRRHASTRTHLHGR